MEWIDYERNVVAQQNAIDRKENNIIRIVCSIMKVMDLVYLSIRPGSMPLCDLFIKVCVTSLRRGRWIFCG